MSGWLANGVAGGSVYTGRERASFDTQASAGANPQVISINVQKLAELVLYFGSYKDKTTVSGTRYYSGYALGQDQIITGINVLVGGTGGTDLWIVELHNSAGTLVATSTTSGTTAGTASTWQQIAFTTPYSALAGTYYIAVQSNGTTAKPSTYNSPTSPLLVGSATGVFGTGASITPPTTYTANLGPVAMAY